MTMRLKKMILSKVYPQFREKITPSSKLNHIHISYKHDENSFLIKMSNKTMLQKADIDNTNSLKNPDIIQVNLDRDTFIRNVLISETLEEINHDLNPKKIVIDFSSPNIAKPFHAGHLRSTLIGNFIGKINKHFGNEVTKINYLGDWGTQFGLLQYGLKEKNIDINELVHEPIRKLYEVYVFANKMSAVNNDVQNEARKYFSDIEHGNKNLESWSKIREITVKELQIIYQRLGIQFDEYHWESDYNGTAIRHLLTKLEELNIMETDATGKKFAKIKDRCVPLLKSDNSTLYLSRDIAALFHRYEKYNFDRMLYVVDNAQTDHFASLFEIVNKINPACAEGCKHIKFGRIKGMSTRTGNVIFLNDILDEAKRKMWEKQHQSKNTRNTAMNDQTCDILGTTAVIINDLKQRRQRDYEFDWNRALQSEGDSGIKLQYLHCRLWSLEQNCGVNTQDVICDPGYLPEKIIGEVVAELARFENILYRAHFEYEACIIVNYLFKLAKHVNNMFSVLKVKDVDSNLAAQRLLVYKSARLVVGTGLEILGVKPLYEM